ncbi:MAG: 5,6-dimethylbenzimidazole synthase [Proteobacteria bacterium]|nr:5,6-dimethylbenzimidazole synthase [Pseudomonadota bacterium]
MVDAPEFDEEFRRRLRDLFAWRRDVRRFRRDPVPEGTLDRLLSLACGAPSVGLSQPWRFVTVDEPGRRAAVRDLFTDCNRAALAVYAGERARLYATLKLAGLGEAPLQFAAFAERDTAQGHGLGRQTMPEAAEYSVVTAIHTLWLAARADGLGLGWVSILDPARVVDILDVPRSWLFIGYFCLGYPQSEDTVPELERADWERRRPAADFILRR